MNLQLPSYISNVKKRKCNFKLFWNFLEPNSEKHSLLLILLFSNMTPFPFIEIFYFSGFFSFEFSHIHYQMALSYGIKTLNKINQ